MLKLKYKKSTTISSIQAKPLPKLITGKVSFLFILFYYFYLLNFVQLAHVDNHNRWRMHACTELQEGWHSQHSQIARMDEVERIRQ